MKSFISNLSKKGRKAIVYIHRWTALLTGLLLLIVTTTGAILIFHNEIYDLENPYLYQPEPEKPITLDQAAQSVQAAYPDSKVTWLGTRNYGGNHGAYEVDIETPDERDLWVYVHPGTGKILGAYDYDKSVLNWLLTLHDLFFLDVFFPDQAPGAVVVGILGILLLLMTLTGIVVWWPSIRNWALAFTVRWKGRGWYIRNFDLHKVVGIFSIPVLFLVSVTGISYEFYDPFTAGWNAVFPGAVEEPEDLKSLPSQAPVLSYGEFLSRAQALYPDAKVTSMYPPEEEDGVMSVYLAASPNPGWMDGDSNITVLMDQHTGDALFKGDLRTAIPSQQFYDGWFWPLHVGSIAGWPSKILWFLTALAPLVLAITGVITWVMRRSAQRKKRVKERRTVVEPEFGTAAGQALGD